MDEMDRFANFLKEMIVKYIDQIDLEELKQMDEIKKRKKENEDNLQKVQNYMQLVSQQHNNEQCRGKNIFDYLLDVGGKSVIVEICA